MNTLSIDWNLSDLAGHDKHGNEISVRELVAAIEGFQAIEAIAKLSPDMRDSLARQAAENHRMAMRCESQQREIAALESALNNTYARISNLLAEHANIQNDAALSALAIYANPHSWANPRNEHGDLKTDQRNVFIKGFHGFELAMSVLQQNKEQAA
ncbi:hypothetical protein MSP8886_01392 [Marinomonas spartinae]|uniref:Uncharacterized protein n=1 Tax=Marinomonas spartinae TaxID=1792290 RepID=A0A1A8T971_9GAMM|nr:hypothetical protein [Marinomonas spartinae]SBS28988.1 hypothetical protein MSP8886_01392 [Marinomonas spartinae]